MMAITVKTDGMDKISEMLTKMEQKAPSIAASALYEGAGIMAQEIVAEAESIRTEPFHYSVFGMREPSPEEKAAILAAGAVGIARFEKNGSEVNTSVGYGAAGYANTFGKEKAVAQIANAINSGTSFMQKQPFVRKAASRGGKKAMQRMTEEIEKKLNEMIK